MSGVRSPNINEENILDELIGNRREGSLVRTGRQSVNNFAAQLLASGPLLQAIEGASAGVIIETTWSALEANAGLRNGQPGRVSGPDAGEHMDPVSAGTVPNMGEYRWDSAAGGWQRTGELQDISAIADEVSNARGGETELVSRLDLTDGVVASLETGLASVSREFDAVIRRTPVQNDPLEIWSDSEGNVYGVVENDGSVRLVGIEGGRSVQDALVAGQDAAKTIYADGVPADENDLLRLLDANGMVAFAIKSDGTIVAPNIDAGVPSDPDNAIAARLRRPEDLFAPAVRTLLADRAVMQGGMRAPPLLNSFEQEYTIGSAWIEEIALIQPELAISIDTPYREDDGVTHPYVAEFYSGFRGYRYFLGLTPYKNANIKEENPVIYGSNDLQSFHMLKGFQQPLDDAPEGTSYNSDIGFTYHPYTGEIVCYWRQTTPTGDGGYCRRSVDGINWTPRETFYPFKPRGDGGWLSPSIIFNLSDGLWYSYAVQAFEPYNLEYRTASAIGGPWSAPTLIPFPATVLPWHMEVKRCGDKWVMLINDRDNGGLHFGISADGKNFTISAHNILSGDYLPPYKASFVPVFNDAGQMAMDVVWTSGNRNTAPENAWKLFSARTQFVNV